MSHLDKTVVNMRYHYHQGSTNQGSILEFLFGGGVDPKKIFGETQRREKSFLGLLRCLGHAPPENFEKIVFRIG